MPKRFPYNSFEMSRLPETDFSLDREVILQLLEEETLCSEIDGGNVTLGIIRPHVGPEANILRLDDVAAADRIEEMIEDLGIIARFSLVLPPDIIDEFYAGEAKERMSTKPPKDERAYTNRWDEFVDAMSSAPLTVLLLHSTEHDAIERWRAQLGHWNINEKRDPTTIRGKLGVNSYNNLVHGSDSIASVHRELSLIKEALRP